MDANIPDFSHLPVTIRRWKFAKRQSIEIDRDFVKVTEKGLDAVNWDEPVLAFTGVVLRRDSGFVWSQYPGPPAFRVMLVHPDPSKTVLLHVTHVEEVARAAWQDAGRKLGLTTLDQTV